MSCEVHKVGGSSCHMCRYIERHAALRRDAMRYRKLRSCPHWTMRDIVWEEAYLGIVCAQGEALDAAVDEIPEQYSQDTERKP
jgi:hypothetical protein